MTKPSQPDPTRDHIADDDESPTPETPRRPRTPEELHQFSINWVRKTGWPTRERDEVIADAVYTKWIEATDADWIRQRSRDYDLLCDLLREAFLGRHDEDGIDSLQILFTLELTLRGRREGKLQRHATH